MCLHPNTLYAVFLSLGMYNNIYLLLWYITSPQPLCIHINKGKDAGNYCVSGIAEMIDEDKVLITELPVGKWTSDYKQMLETMLVGNTEVKADKKDDGTVVAPVATFIKDFKEVSRNFVNLTRWAIYYVCTTYLQFLWYILFLYYCV